MRGTYLNTATVLTGSLLGLAFKHYLPPQYNEITIDMIAVATGAMGIRMFLKTANPVVPILSALIGILIGHAIGIEVGIQRLGDWFQNVFAPKDSGSFATGCVTASILFCVGPMTVLGCLEDGLQGKSPLLWVKSVFDGISALFLAAAFGAGVVLSAAVVLVLQGGLTLAARPLSKATQKEGRVEELTACGGLILAAMGLRILQLKQIPVGDILPGLVLAPFIVTVLAKKGWYP